MRVKNFQRVVLYFTVRIFSEASFTLYELFESKREKFYIAKVIQSVLMENIYARYMRILYKIYNGYIRVMRYIKESMKIAVSMFPEYEKDLNKQYIQKQCSEISCQSEENVIFYIISLLLIHVYFFCAASNTTFDVSKRANSVDNRRGVGSRGSKFAN